MGWKGNVRTIHSAYKRSIREAERRERENIRQQKQYDKAQQLRNDRREYEEYQEYYYMLKSLHGECSKPVDWNKILNSKQPSKPKKYKTYENKAQKQKDIFKPGLIDKIFKRDIKKLDTLERDIIQATQEDKMNYNRKIDAWEIQCKEWREKVEIAKKVISNDTEIKLKIIDKYKPFSDISELGTSVIFSATENEPVTITLKTHGVEIIPTEVKSLLQSGKLSVKKMPKGQYNELFQDHVCSAVLRIANETFSILPDELVIINATDKILNTKTGHREEQIILSVGISRETLKPINLKRIDPSDCMGNFVHNMSFKKLKGFAAVKKLNEKYFIQSN